MIIFYLKMGIVTPKRLTSQCCLPLSGPSYLLRDLLQVLSASRTRSVQMCTTTRRKRQRRALHRNLPNAGSPPHSTGLNAGDNPPE